MVELVNSRLESELPIDELLAGSVDPDKSAYANYTGIESKHHHDDGRGAGRPHTSDHIQKIVYDRCLSARKFWLANDRRSAAFHFGVATHFYMDGFICSPSVDEEDHRSGDARFANAVNRTDAPHVDVAPETGKHHVVAEICRLSGSFGSNDTRIVPDAIGVLIALGQAITAASVSENFTADLQHAVGGFLDWIRVCERNFTIELTSEEAFNTIVDSSVQRTAGQLIKSRFIMRCLFAAHLFDNRGKELMCPIIAVAVRWCFRRKLTGDARRTLRRTMKPYFSELHSEHELRCDAISRLTSDPEWYCPEMANHLKKKGLSDLNSSNDAFFARLRSFKRSIPGKISPRLPSVEEECVAKSQELGSALWESTFSNWVGKECTEFPALKYLWSGVPLFVVLVFVMLAAFYSALNWAVVALAIAMSLVLAACIWTMASACQSIRKTFQQWISLTCPRCHSEIEMWRFNSERVVRCPDCQQTINLAPLRT